MPPQHDAVRRILERQGQVVARRQLVEIGATGAWVSRRASSGRWQRLLPGVYLAHSGPVSWRDRAHAAVLYAGDGAALSHRSAAYVYRMVPNAPRLIEVSVATGRRVAPQPGLVVHRRTMPNGGGGGRLSTLGPADTVVDVVATMTTPDEVIGLVCSALRERAAPGRILAALAARPRVRNRALLVELVGEAEEGIESTLEHRYHHDVERRHGLPASTLQVRQRLGGWWVRADRIHEGLGVRIELDGELAHPGGRTDRDVWRDNEALVSRGEITLRYRWRHVLVGACATARQVEQALVARGWPECGRPCGPTCPVGR